MYAVPFYGESSFLVYRKDLFAKAGITMPAHPTWQQIADYAAKLDDKNAGIAGICLRGLPGLGREPRSASTPWPTRSARVVRHGLERPARPRRSSRRRSSSTSPRERPRRAGRLQRRLLRVRAPPTARARRPCGTTPRRWPAPPKSRTAARSSASPAMRRPRSRRPGHSGWLYTWSLGSRRLAKDKDDAWKFMAWVTEQGSTSDDGRRATSAGRACRRAAGSRHTRSRSTAIAATGPRSAALEVRRRQPPQAKVSPVPYTGIQFVGIPEFQDLGTRVQQQFVRGDRGPDAQSRALKQSQKYAQDVGDPTRNHGFDYGHRRHAAPGTHAALRSAKRRTNKAVKRRRPLLPALIFSIAVTQLPFLLTIYYSFSVVEPGAAGVGPLRRLPELRRRFQRLDVPRRC